ncbi:MULTISPECIES: sulfite exporter TauE/SafE family protein [Roseovarius]|uniref:sulfite exporter TauE/SafE family protein n=1 Tax=Roseovarius TaxID=74030 RepID=UPI001C93A9E9|nr:sulfite exporter TauE/SafE family protein [Roseovarius atlanticus]MBY5990054.1 sulfite exporter TauE/SafE family protein [Roseovarius atlanticus]MBY6126599.1 sulfite exporter TauE/SafE family protein [Roseovarius atlanticus]MBY6151093.1 sulfite exporter TauE/SafE family protein [Roseovarius atlanticus]
MDALLGPDWLMVMAFAWGVAVLGGLVKGVVGFAMPMVVISGLSTVMPPEVALAGLILPTLASNGWQALRQGVRAAWGSLTRFRVFLLAGMMVMLISAQLVRAIPEAVMLLLIGVPIIIYAGFALAGRPLRLPPNPGRRVEAGIGAVAGFFGGISGVWGPPTVAMLTALDTEKTEQMRVQGVIYGMGAVLLTGAHTVSGVLNRATLPLSLSLIVPALIGLGIGFMLQDRIDQRLFRRLTLAVLVIAGLNLVRRGIMSF